MACVWVVVACASLKALDNLLQLTSSPASAIASFRRHTPIVVASFARSALTTYIYITL